MSEPILSIQNLQVNYGGIEAVKGISFDVPEGEIITLIGANGAGKSSTLRAISGLVKPRGGKILYRGEDITGKNPTEIVSKGVTLVPEGRRIFADLTVKENLKVGAYLRKRYFRGYGVGFQSVSPSAGTCMAGRRHTLRWRTADVGRRPRTDEPPEGYDDG